MNYTKKELLDQCSDLGITKCASKTKSQLVALIAENTPLMTNTTTTTLQETNTTTTTTLRFIDLFCGIGGFHQAMVRFSGATCVFACDIDESCRQIYHKNYGLTPESDITAVNVSTIPDFDVLCAGFPCQAFSNSGKKKGFSDKRGNLFEHILKIAVEKRPRFMFLENVKHIKKIDNGKVYEHIIARIRASGYTVQDFELSPHQLGIPQQRERVIFVCIRNDIYDSNKEIVICPPPNIPIQFDSVLETNPSNKYKVSAEVETILNVWNEMVQTVHVNETLSPTILCNEFKRVYSEEEFVALPDWKQDYITKNKPLYQKYQSQWDDWYSRNRTILTKKEIYGKLEWQVGKTREQESIFNHFIQLRQSGIRVKRAIYFPTLVAIVQTPIYAKERRYITPRECARLQSFPDHFIMHENDHTAYKQFGNAVNVDVVHYVMKKTFELYV
jgi:DNA (cytosine-5)-methyltransferase 1